MHAIVALIFASAAVLVTMWLIEGRPSPAPMGAIVGAVVMGLALTASRLWPRGHIRR